MLAPASGVVAFAGSVGANGKVVTIETDDGYSVTLVHLGAFSVGKGDAVGEGAPVGTIGPSGTPEHDVPYVHLGVRVTSDSQGYVDPLTLLPPRAAPAPPPPPSPAPPPAVELVPPPPVHVAPPAAASRRPSHNRPRLRHRQARMHLRRRSSPARCSSPLPRHRRTRLRSPRACTRGGRSNRSLPRRAPAVAVCFWSLRFQSLELSVVPRRCQLRSCRGDVRGRTEASQARASFEPSSTADLGAPWRNCARRREAHGEAPTVTRATTPAREVDDRAVWPFAAVLIAGLLAARRNSRSVRPRARRRPSDGPYTLSTCGST